MYRSIGPVPAHTGAMSACIRPMRAGMDSRTGCIGAMYAARRRCKRSLGRWVGASRRCVQAAGRCRQAGPQCVGASDRCQDAAASGLLTPRDERMHPADASSMGLRNGCIGARYTPPGENRDSSRPTLAIAHVCNAPIHCARPGLSVESRKQTGPAPHPCSYLSGPEKWRNVKCYASPRILASAKVGPRLDRDRNASHG